MHADLNNSDTTAYAGACVYVYGARAHERRRTYRLVLNRRGRSSCSSLKNVTAPSGLRTSALHFIIEYSLEVARVWCSAPPALGVYPIIITRGYQKKHVVDGGVGEELLTALLYLYQHRHLGRCSRAPLDGCFHTSDLRFQVNSDCVVEHDTFPQSDTKKILKFIYEAEIAVSEAYGSILYIYIYTYISMYAGSDTKLSIVAALSINTKIRIHRDQY